MKKLEPLTEQEATEYLYQLARRGTAKSLPVEQVESHRAAYDALTAYLKRNYKAYIFYCLVGSKRPSKKALISTIERVTTTGLLRKLNEALDAGDLEGFQWYCWILKAIYCIFLHEEETADKQKETIDL